MWRQPIIKEISVGLEINFIALDSTNWAIWGVIAADTAPAFGDQ